MSEKTCIFCMLVNDGACIIAENETCISFADRNPVTAGHTLVIPKRHEADYFQLTAAERQDIQALLEGRRAELLAADATISGFNIGVNIGAAAGQTVFHCHVHLIPRRQGDTPEPRGGVRGVIPAKQAY